MWYNDEVIGSKLAPGTASFYVFSYEFECGLASFDKYYRRSPPAERLKTYRSCSCEEIQYDAIGDIALDYIEETFTGSIGCWADGLRVTFGYGQLAASAESTDNSHWFSNKKK